jgi:hypothetical protein
MTQSSAPPPSASFGSGLMLTLHNLTNLVNTNQSAQSTVIVESAHSHRASSELATFYDQSKPNNEENSIRINPIHERSLSEQLTDSHPIHSNTPHASSQRGVCCSIFFCIFQCFSFFLRSLNQCLKRLGCHETCAKPGLCGFPCLWMRVKPWYKSYILWSIIIIAIVLASILPIVLKKIVGCTRPADFVFQDCQISARSSDPSITEKNLISLFDNDYSTGFRLSSSNYFILESVNSNHYIVNRIVFSPHRGYENQSSFIEIHASTQKFTSTNNYQKLIRLTAANYGQSQSIVVSTSGQPTVGWMSIKILSVGNFSWGLSEIGIFGTNLP